MENNQIYHQTIRSHTNQPTRLSHATLQTVAAVHPNAISETQTTFIKFKTLINEDGGHNIEELEIREGSESIQGMSELTLDLRGNKMGTLYTCNLTPAYNQTIKHEAAKIIADFGATCITTPLQQTDEQIPDAEMLEFEKEVHMVQLQHSVNSIRENIMKLHNSINPNKGPDYLGQKPPAIMRLLIN